MLKIAVCDDIDEFQNEIFNLLGKVEEQLKDEFDIDVFSSGEELCSAIKNKSYDIILLDILMNGIDGIETSKRIRAMGEESLIIFISSYDERLKEMFGKNVIAFIDKPIDHQLLKNEVIRGINIVQSNNVNLFTFEKNGHKLYVPFKDIMYFEASKSHTIIHTTKESISYYNVFKSVWDKINMYPEFIMPSRSIIANLKHVSINGNVVMIGEKFLCSIGRQNKYETKERYFNYIERRSE